MNFLDCYIKPDEWRMGENLKESDGYVDTSFAGCEYRLPTWNATGYELAVNITVTGRKSFWNGSTYETRVRIEFVGDGEPSEFTGALIYTKDPIKAVAYR